MNAAPNFNGTRFENTVTTDSPSVGKVLKIITLMATKNRDQSVPAAAIPIKRLSYEQLEALPDDQLSVVRLGHSTLLLKINGEYWLTDPVFSKRASPVSFAGPRRFHTSPINLDELPHISRVLISHNHFDHLDKKAIKVLATNASKFFAPLGVEGYLEKWGVPTELISSFGWWQELKDTNSLVAFTPAQHFSGRGFSDRDKSLWGSWVIKTDNRSLFFSGDSGYFSGFKTIGDRYGPFDMTFMETGAYSSQWPDMHLFPEQSVQAHLDLGGRILYPIHNGTFDLAFHGWKDPLEQISAAASNRGVYLATPLIGEIITIGQTIKTSPWWRSVK